MTNSITIEFAKGGFIIHTSTERADTVEVVNSVGKLNKAIRAAVEELSLLPKKADETEAE